MATYVILTLNSWNVFKIIQDIFSFWIVHSQYDACRCTGDFRSQCISRDGIDAKTRNMPSPVSEELTTRLYMSTITTMSNMYSCVFETYSSLVNNVCAAYVRCLPRQAANIIGSVVWNTSVCHTSWVCQLSFRSPPLSEEKWYASDDRYFSVIISMLDATHTFVTFLYTITRINIHITILILHTCIYDYDFIIDTMWFYQTAPD